MAEQRTCDWVLQNRQDKCGEVADLWQSFWVCKYHRGWFIGRVNRLRETAVRQLLMFLEEDEE